MRQKAKDRTRTKSPTKERKEASIRVVLPFVNTISSRLKRAFHNKDIDIAFKSSNTLRSRLVHAKDKVPRQIRSGIVYKITCADCHDCYIGETSRTLNERLKEHKRALRLNNPSQSAIAEHSHNTGHNIKWDEARIIDFESNWLKRKIKEALWIRRVNPALNRDSGYTLSPIYGPVINKDRQRQQDNTPLH